MGRMMCDSPQILVETMFQSYLDTWGKPDVLIITGDQVAHHIALEPSMTSPDDWYGNYSYELLIETLDVAASLIQKYFGDVVVLPVIGNNDSKYHDSAVPEADKKSYYEHTHDLWFKQIKGNAHFANDPQLVKSFSTGGFYRVDLTDTLSFLGLNSMYYAEDGEESFYADEQEVQLVWLESQLALASSTSRKFIIADHIYAGGRREGEQMWYAEYNERYF